MFTDDPIADFLRHDREQQRKLDKLPKCDDCGKAIQDDYHYNIYGEVFCEECLNRNFRKVTEIR